jgi:4-diphosphocytidyl-2-C-methyl-D-erythritol kinase
MSVKTYILKTPAKINIGLRVLSKRTDGYHNIETIFYPVKIFDTVKVKIGKISSHGNNISVKTVPIGIIDDGENICLKAANLFLTEYKIKDSYKIQIYIRKNIPVSAGLGGGSSDAAAVLKILAGHFKNKEIIREPTLRKIAIRLGSDVPFFLRPVPSYAWSRGEKMIPLKKFRINYHLLVVYPHIHISTKWAFNKLNITAAKKKSMNHILGFREGMTGPFQNDFENVVFDRFPLVRQIKEKICEFGSVFCSMSGSGSSVYGFFDHKNIQPAFKYFKDKDFKVFKVKN